MFVIVTVLASFGMIVLAFVITVVLLEQDSMTKMENEMREPRDIIADALLPDNTDARTLALAVADGAIEEMRQAGYIIVKGGQDQPSQITSSKGVT